MNNKLFLLLFFLSLINLNDLYSQDTFSIVALDPDTGEVGSAGASCVDATTGTFNGHQIGELFPGRGAINTQAAYIPGNQTRARDRMNAGDTPQEIITYMINNDVSGNSTRRQYGVTAFTDGTYSAAAHTGSNCIAYANQIVGQYYAIQGNILLDQSILDNMEANFLNTQGDLACKLMAALQGAKVVGADTRCASNGTSALFAYVKVAQPNDVFGSPSLFYYVETADNAGTEPIDVLQNDFDADRNCIAPPDVVSNDAMVTVLPCTVPNIYVVTGALSNYTINILNSSGTVIQQHTGLNNYFEIDITTLPSGIHFIEVVHNSNSALCLQQIIKYF